MTTFRTTILQTGKTTAGIEVPPEVIDALGGGRRPSVKVTLNGRYSFPYTVASMGGAYMIGLSSDRRAESGLAGGDEVEVDVVLDNTPRQIEVPAQLAAALDADPAARATFEELSYSNKSWHVLQVTGAKTDETRDRRIAKSMASLREGRPR
jgi:hypothetical protein